MNRENITESQDNRSLEEIIHDIGELAKACCETIDEINQSLKGDIKVIKRTMGEGR